MKDIKLQLKQAVPNHLRLDMSSLRTDQLLESSELEIARTLIGVGNRTDQLGDWFSVTVNSQESKQRLRVEIEGDLCKVDFLGSRFSDCDLHVHGNVGDHLGHAMVSGSIVVHGNAGCHCGNQMRGGSIKVAGNSGNYLGGARISDRRGMQGGRLIIQGKVGHHAGHRMRRGVIIVHSDVGEGLGMRMIAGTIVVCGAVGKGIGCGMRRGTILRLSVDRTGSNMFKRSDSASSESSVSQVAGFTPAVESELSFLPILLQSIRSDLPPSIQACLPESQEMLPRRGLRCQGDRSIFGLGEVITL